MPLTKSSDGATEGQVKTTPFSSVAHTLGEAANPFPEGAE